MFASLSSLLLKRFAVLLAILTALGLLGCQAYLDERYQTSLPPTQGQQPLVGLFDAVSVRRNTLGVPFIEGRNFHDTVFALGYVHASDRLSQMLGMRRVAQGRLAEQLGAEVLALDRFMRAVNLRQSAQQLYRSASPQMRNMLEVYARGVNAYIYRYRDQYPLDLAGQKPEYWQPEDSALVFCLIQFGLSVNVQEEIASLVMAQKVGADKLHWLLPIYPDEDLPLEEANKLKGLNLKGKIPEIAGLNQLSQDLERWLPMGMAASNNWAVAGARTLSGKPLLANDPHLPLSMPSYWTLVQVKGPEFEAAGLSIAGIPAVVAGFNGRLAWGMTMVMGDTQDIFLEQIRNEKGHLEYLAEGQWLLARERQETYIIKGRAPIREPVYETRNGPLLNLGLVERKHSMQPVAIHTGYGLALKTPSLEGDQSLEAFFKLSQASSVPQAFEPARAIQAVPLNLVFADRQSIAWQVTGRYPNRRSGLGLIPSPGWTADYQWEGFAEPMLHPYDQDPAQGWLGTANHRTVSRGYGLQLSSSWHYPERFERLSNLVTQGKQDVRTTTAMQYDQTTGFASKLKTMLQGPGMAQPLAQAIQALPIEQRRKAQEALKHLLVFDGGLEANSAEAAVYGAFLFESARQIFLDELGPEDSSTAWQALVQTANNSYSAQADHLLGRDESPFWDDIRTPQLETKPEILARSLAASIQLLESKLGTDRTAWQWGKLHTYHWLSSASQMAPNMGMTQRLAVGAVSDYLNRGPYPAGGDFATLNVAANRWGSNFDVWLIPSARFIVDFGRDEPMLVVNSSGQSGNPSSPHYADGIEAWLKGQYMSLPFKVENQTKVYGSTPLRLVPEKAAAAKSRE